MHAWTIGSRNAYDNEPEFYVIVKEVGSREFEKTQEEIRRTLKKASLGSSTSRHCNHIYIYMYVCMYMYTILELCMEIFTNPEVPKTFQHFSAAIKSWIFNTYYMTHISFAYRTWPFPVARLMTKQFLTRMSSVALTRSLRGRPQTRPWQLILRQLQTPKLWRRCLFCKTTPLDDSIQWFIINFNI